MTAIPNNMKTREISLSIINLIIGVRFSPSSSLYILPLASESFSQTALISGVRKGQITAHYELIRHCLERRGHLQEQFPGASASEMETVTSAVDCIGIPLSIGRLCQEWHSLPASQRGGHHHDLVRGISELFFKPCLV